MSSGDTYQLIFDSLEDAFMHFTEVQLATLEDYISTPRKSKSSINRQKAIAMHMVEECRRRKIAPPAPPTKSHLMLPRLRDLLKTPSTSP